VGELVLLEERTDATAADILRGKGNEFNLYLLSIVELSNNEQNEAISDLLCSFYDRLSDHISVHTARVKYVVLFC
jgi:hypothetical protein